MTSTVPSVCVLVLNWNAASVLGACIESVLAQRYDGGLSVLVVDNASTDDSGALLARYADQIEVLALPENIGFAKGNNTGFRRVASDVVVFLNPDTEFVGTDSLARLVEPLRREDVGLVGPHLLNADRTTQRSCSTLPSITTIALQAASLHRLLPDGLRRRLAPVAWSHDRSTDTGWLAGACLAMRSADVRAVGGFSEATFMYGEDLDLGYRVRRLGRRVRFEHSAKLIHYQDVSSSQRWTSTELAEKVARGEAAFLSARYRGVHARVAELLMLATYGVRAVAFKALGRRSRATDYAAMARVFATPTRR